MNWIYDNKPFEPTEAIRGIVYRMSLDGFWYIGKKTIKSPKGKPTKYQDYFGSGKRWLQHIGGREQEVERQVVYLCANLTEMDYWESYLLYSTHAIFREDSMNDNVSMITNRRTSKNFINKPETI
ncbi:GIY-YIG nuclease family protein [Gluconacetobacter dulcium]|nr:hypothetical protein [Gluconacetobacter dulcium]